MNRTRNVQSGVATRHPGESINCASRRLLSILGIGTALFVACATTVNGSPVDGVDGAVNVPDSDTVGTTDTGSLPPTPDGGVTPMNDVGVAPMDSSPPSDGMQPNDSSVPSMEGSPSNEAAPLEAAPPMDSPPPPMDSPPPPMDSPPAPMDGPPPPPVDSGGKCPSAQLLPRPFPVDGTGGSRFFPYGYDGDYCAIQQTGTPGACAGHTLPGAVGQCWSVTVTTRSACTDGGVVKGFAGVRWQYPANNWSDPSTLGGLNLCGATKVSFWAKGAVGGETVSFHAGNLAYVASLPSQVLAAKWTQFMMPFTGAGPDSVVSQGFFWLVNEAAAPGSTVSFMIDDIVWQ